MRNEIKETPCILKFLIGIGLLEIFFNSTMPDRIGINPHWDVPLFGFLVIAVIVWVVFGSRGRSDHTESAE